MYKDFYVAYKLTSLKLNLPDELDRTELLELLGTPWPVNVRLLFKCLGILRAVIKWLANGIIPGWAIALDCFFGLEDLGFGLGLRGGDWVVRTDDPPTGLEGRGRGLTGLRGGDWVVRTDEPPTDLEGRGKGLRVSWKTSGFVGGSGLLRINASLLVKVLVIRCILCFLRNAVWAIKWYSHDIRIT